MLNIIFSMISCSLHDYHIDCPFSAGQIRKAAKPDHKALYILFRKKIPEMESGGEAKMKLWHLTGP